MKKIEHNGQINHPLGGASYVWKKEYVSYILEQLSKSTTKDEVKISIGIQPNSSPHFGTLTVLSLGFSLARKLKEAGKKASVALEAFGIAPTNSENTAIEGIRYQKNLDHTGEINNYIPEYEELLKELSSYSNVDFEMRDGGDLFDSYENSPQLIEKIIKERDFWGSFLSPETKLLAFRASCPKCGLADKHGIKNIYNDNEVSFFCPAHGYHQLSIKKDIKKLEYNNPTRSLLEGFIYQEENKNEEIPHYWIILMGSDYAGPYQEQFSYRGPLLLGAEIDHLPIFVYSPLITDWSGAKLSKSLYVRGDAYNYLKDQNLDYLVNYRKLKEKFGAESLQIVYDEACLWLKEPYRLFRNYSLYYFDELFKASQVKESDASFDSKIEVNKELDSEAQTEALIIHQEPVIFDKKILN